MNVAAPTLAALAAAGRAPAVVEARLRFTALGQAIAPSNSAAAWSIAAVAADDLQADRPAPLISFSVGHLIHPGVGARATCCQHTRCACGPVAEVAARPRPRTARWRLGNISGIA